MRSPERTAPGAAVTGQDDPHTNEVVRAAPSRRLELISAAVAVACSGALVLLARAIEVRRETGGLDPRWWPESLGLAGLALATVLLCTSAARPPARRGEITAVTRAGWLRLMVTVSLTTAFLALWPMVGFVAVTPFFLCAVTYVFGGRGWVPLLLYPVVLPGIIYLFFHTLLKVPL